MRRKRLPPWAVSWLQVSPLALILVILFALPTLLFFVISFFDYDRVGIYPAFMWDNYRELLTTPATLRIYVSSLQFAVLRELVGDGDDVGRLAVGVEGEDRVEDDLVFGDVEVGALDGFNDIRDRVL